MTAKPKPTKADRPRKAKKSKPRRQILEAQLEAICKQIVFWRDGSQCVEREIDGRLCNSIIQWGHYIPRSRSAWMKYDLGNTFCQCSNHNLAHRYSDQVMGAWFGSFFGNAAALAMNAEKVAHVGQDRTIPELEEMLIKYTELYDNRFSCGADFYDLVRGGYYGEIIKEAV